MTTDTPTPKIKTLLRRAARGSRTALSVLAYSVTFLALVAVFAIAGGALLWFSASGDLTFGDAVAAVAMLAFGLALIVQTWWFITWAWDVADFVRHLVQHGVKPVNDHDEARDGFDDGLRSIDEYRPLAPTNTVTLTHQQQAWPAQEELSEQIAKEVAWANRGAKGSTSDLAVNAVSAEKITADPVSVGAIAAGTVSSARIVADKITAHTVPAEPDRDGDDGGTLAPATTS